MAVNKITATVADLLKDYHELNSETAEELSEEPSPLEFMRYVAQNRPFVVRKAARSWPACKMWTTNYLIDRMGESFVKVAVTPNGNADAVVENEDGSLLFIKPYEIDERFKDMIKYLRDQESSVSWSGPTKYAQSQNDNLRNEYAPLFKDIPDTLDFARIALQRDPDAINFWLGNSYSTTSMHKDNYENIYVQILGSKKFTILPPIEAPCVHEQYLTCATYKSVDSQHDTNSEGRLLMPQTDSPQQTIPFPTWDPEFPSQRASAFSKYARPMEIELSEGDMLYLPALWYHKVSQTCNSEGLCSSVNYWYDMDFNGSLPSLAAFVQNIAHNINRK